MLVIGSLITIYMIQIKYIVLIIALGIRMFNVKNRASKLEFLIDYPDRMKMASTRFQISDNPTTGLMFLAFGYQY